MVRVVISDGDHGYALAPSIHWRSMLFGAWESALCKEMDKTPLPQPTHDLRYRLPEPCMVI